MMLVQKDDEGGKERVEHHRSKYLPVYGAFDEPEREWPSSSYVSDASSTIERHLTSGVYVSKREQTE